MMAKRVVIKRSQSIESGGTGSHASGDKTAFATVFDLDQLVEERSKTPETRIHDSSSAIWAETHSVDVSTAGNLFVNPIPSTSKGFDRNSVASSATKQKSVASRVNVDGDNLSLATQRTLDDAAPDGIPRDALGGIEEFALEAQCEYDNQAFVSETVAKAEKKNTYTKESQFEYNEVLIRNETEVENNIPVVLREKKRRNRTGEYNFSGALDLGRSDSTKRLLTASTSSSNRDSSTVGESAEFDDDQVLYTESEFSAKQQARRASKLSSKSNSKLDVKQTIKEAVHPQMLIEKEDRQPKEIARRYVKHKKLKTQDEISGQTFINKKEADSTTINASQRIKNTLELPKEYKLFPSGNFDNHTRAFREKRIKIVSLEKPIESVSQPFSKVYAEVPPPNPKGEKSFYDQNINSLFASRHPITLANTHTDHMMSKKRSISKSMNSLTDTFGPGASRYTVRGLSALPNELKVVAVPQDLQRTTLRKVKSAIEMAISNFQIKFDNESGQYHPGMPMTGKVVMDVWSTVEIRYVEFVLQGRATVRIFGKDGKFMEKPFNEMYLQKRIILLAPDKGEVSMTLVPGKYVSDFAYKLPEELPTSVNQTDVSESCVFSVSYSARANVCDFLHAKHVPQSERYAQVVKACRKEFTIMPAYDMRCVPGAMEPITHAEQFNLLCSPIGTSATSVLVKLDHQVFALGDTMNLSLEVCTPDPKRIKGITGHMVQTVVFQPPVNKKYSRTVIKAVDVQRYQQLNNQRRSKTGSNGHSKNMYRCSFGIPIPANLIPSLLLYARIIQVSYRMDIKVAFKNFGGSLNMNIPVILTSHMEAEPSSAPIPLFSKPVMQFPYFSRGPLRDSAKSNTSAQSAGSQGSHRSGTSENAVNRGMRIEQKHERVNANYVSCFNF